MITRRLLIISAIVGMMLCHIGAMATAQWCAVAASKDIPLDDIECFVATDGECTMNIVLVSGEVLSDLPSVSFAVREYNGVEDILSDQSDILLINNIIHITHATSHDEASVVDLGGRVISCTTVVGGECHIDISDLSAGVYILNLGNKSIKFAKR